MSIARGLFLKVINSCKALYVQLICFILNRSLWDEQLEQDVELIGVVGHSKYGLREEGWDSKREKVCLDAKKRISNHFGVHMPKRHKEVATASDIKMMESWEMSEIEFLAEKLHKVQYGVRLAWAVVIGHMPIWLFCYIAINMGDVNYRVILMSILAVGLYIAVMASFVKKEIEAKWVQNSIKQLAEECERRFTHLDASVQRVKLHDDFSALDTRRTKLTAL